MNEAKIYLENSAVELFRDHRGDHWIPKTTFQVMQQVDDVTTREGREALFIMSSNFEELKTRRLGVKVWVPWGCNCNNSPRRSTSRE